MPRLRLTSPYRSENDKNHSHFVTDDDGARLGCCELAAAKGPKSRSKTSLAKSIGRRVRIETWLAAGFRRSCSDRKPAS